MIVVIERAVCFLPRQRHRDAPRICEVDVQPAVLIVVKKQDAPRHRFVKILLLRRNSVLEGDAAGGGHICKPDLGGFYRWRALGAGSDNKRRTEKRDQQKPQMKERGKIKNENT